MAPLQTKHQKLLTAVAPAPPPLPPSTPRPPSFLLSGPFIPVIHSPSKPFLSFVSDPDFLFICPFSHLLSSSLTSASSSPSSLTFFPSSSSSSLLTTFVASFLPPSLPSLLFSFLPHFLSFFPASFSPNLAPSLLTFFLPLLLPTSSHLLPCLLSSDSSLSDGADLDIDGRLVKGSRGRSKVSCIPSFSSVDIPCSWLLWDQPSVEN